MAYRALYRTYRPQLFEDVIGQSHITTILKNQVESGHIAHAYLFCGSRGTGKTSTAKIFARAVTCLSPKNGEPCGECEACKRSVSEACPDITEIDAASNNRVDDVRALIESAQYAPMELVRRVFIVDEVHMLTGPAFNALLKTLEEPPAHIMFILATTEPQKLPATIISRCQRFDFHRLTISDIKLNLSNVLQKAGAEIDDGGLSVIARAADGGMRDALSLADQCLSFCGDHVTEKDVYDVLGGVEQDFLFRIADALAGSDARSALDMLDSVVRGGRDMSVFCQDLGRHFRALLLAKTCGSCEDLLDCTPDLMKRYLEQAAPVSQIRLLTALETILRTQGELRYLSSPRALLESMLVRICRPETSLTLDNLEARIDRLESGFVPSPAASVPSVGNTPASATPSVPVASVQPEPPLYEPEDIPLPEPPPAEDEQLSAPVKRGPVSGDTGADALWSLFLKELMKTQPLLYNMLLGFVPQKLADNKLTVGYMAADEAKMKSASVPGMMNKLLNTLHILRPDTSILFTPLHESVPDPDTEAKLKEIFRDKLIIED